MKMIEDLFIKYLDNECSPDEVKQLLAHFNVDDNEEVLRGLITQSLLNAGSEAEETQWTPALDDSLFTIKKQIKAGNAKIIPLPKRQWFRIAAAAVLLAAIFTTYMLVKNPEQEQTVAKVDTSGKNVHPGSNKAVLTLADGSTIFLQTAAKGIVAQQGETRIEKSAEGLLSYKSVNEKPTKVLLNTVTTPRGGQYQVILSDGSMVWLNAASSLRFQTHFTGSERKVTLTGEAYFEVAKNAASPFKVEVAGKGEVEVLGTHFNVNAYSDEAVVKTTLLEGKVKVKGPAGNHSEVLLPGQEAMLDKKGQVLINRNVDTEQAIAWKNGVFSFTNASLEVVMRQISRWHDVDVVFEDRQVAQRRFSGDIQRDLTLKQVMKILENNHVFCRLEGQKLIVQNK
jgi:transmembrane sensor